jgi:hypothetical protein
VRIPITIISSTEQPGVGSAPSPELHTVKQHVQGANENYLKTDYISDHLAHELSEPIPLSTPTRWNENVDTRGTGEQCLVQVVDLADMVSQRDLEGILDRRSDTPRDQLELFSSPQEALPELLDFSIDIEQILASGDSLQQDRPKGKLLKFEQAAHLKAVPPVDVVDSSNSTRTPAKIIEFRRPESLN